MTAESNRQAFPWTAQKVDELRAVFGEGVRVAACAEGGRTAGKFLPDLDEAIREEVEAVRQRFTEPSLTAALRKRRMSPASVALP